MDYVQLMDDSHSHLLHGFRQRQITNFQPAQHDSSSEKIKCLRVEVPKLEEPTLAIGAS